MSTHLNVGDPVKWVVRRNRGRSIDFKQMEGTLLEINEAEGVGIVKKRNHHKTTVRLDNLRHLTNEQGLLTEFLHALAQEDKRL